MSFMGMGEHNAPRFCWLASGAITAKFDLRLCGWLVDTAATPSHDCVGLVDASLPDNALLANALASLSRETRRHVLVAGVGSAAERSRFLQLGFGDAVAESIAIEELRARAERLLHLSQFLPRRRRLGRLTLDLLAREAYFDSKALNLNPREFALIWRLADSMGETVSKETLIYDVWRMGFVPETNSVAVHMSRLRRKLSFVGIAGIIATSPTGGYRLLPPEQDGICPAPALKSEVLREYATA